jgi:teichuronic acid biosynthesis protein TuaE
MRPIEACRSTYAPTPDLVAVVLVAAGLGALASVSPLLIVGAVTFALLLAPLYTRRVVASVAPLAVLAVSPFIVSGTSFGDTAQKACVIVTLAALLLRWGVRRNPAATIALVVLALSLAVSVVDAAGSAETSTSESARAFAGFALPWLVLMINFPREHAHRLLRAVSALPLVSVCLGLLLDVGGVTDVVSFDAGGARLQGASIPAHLAMMCVAGIVAGLATATTRHVRYGVPVLAFNVLALLATGTRGAIAAAFIVLAIFASRSALAARLPAALRRTGGVIGVVGVVGLLVAAPELIARSAGNAYEGSFNTSGRGEAWSFYARLAGETWVAGRGLGFSAIANERYQPQGVQAAFAAPHNEYIHFVLDGGLILGVGYAAALLVLFVSVFWSADPVVRPLVIACGLSLMVYSAVDNTLSTPQLCIPLFAALAAIPGLRPTRQEPMSMTLPRSHHP